MHRRRTVLAFSLAVVLLPLAAGAPASASRSEPRVLHQGVVTRQDVGSRVGSEPDTVVEPDIAVNPTNGANAVAVAHDSRYPDGGAVAMSAAWTKDAGRHWRHAPVPDVTTATGGRFDRASDPVVAFGPNGTAYLSILAIDVNTCDSAVLVLRSGSGGKTWSGPFVAQISHTRTYSDDKNWLVVDNWGEQSPPWPPLPVLDTVPLRRREPDAVPRFSAGASLVR